MTFCSNVSRKFEKRSGSDVPGLSSKGPRRVALITGASSGIGQAFAEEYAKLGVDLVVVARKVEPLDLLSARLKSDHQISVTVLTGDLADPETPQKLFDTLLKKSIKVNILVNNAGYGVPGELCDIEWERHRDTIEVMATAPVRMCYLFAPAMMKEGFGRIINVSSLSALLPPHAGGTLYYPVKSFLHQFSLAFRAEMRVHNVYVTSLCPGFTRTNFQDAAGGTVEKVSPPEWTWSDPNSVARTAIEAVDNNRAFCVPGIINKAIAATFKVLPGALGRRLVGG